MTKITDFPENVTDKPDTQKITVFHEISVKKCQFSQKPLGLDKDFDTFDRSVLPWCQLWSRGVNFVKKCQKPQ